MPKRPTHKQRKLQHQPKEKLKIKIPVNIASLTKEQLQAIVRILRRDQNIGLKIFNLWFIAKPPTKAASKPWPNKAKPTDELFENSDPPGTDF